MLECVDHCEPRLIADSPCLALLPSSLVDFITYFAHRSSTRVLPLIPTPTTSRPLFPEFRCIKMLNRNCLVRRVPRLAKNSLGEILQTTLLNITPQAKPNLHKQNRRRLDHKKPQFLHCLLVIIN